MPIPRQGLVVIVIATCAQTTSTVVKAAVKVAKAATAIVKATAN